MYNRLNQVVIRFRQAFQEIFSEIDYYRYRKSALEARRRATPHGGMKVLPNQAHFPLMALNGVSSQNLGAYLGIARKKIGTMNQKTTSDKIL